MRSHRLASRRAASSCGNDHHGDGLRQPCSLRTSVGLRIGCDWRRHDIPPSHASLDVTRRGVLNVCRCCDPAATDKWSSPLPTSDADAVRAFYPKFQIVIIVPSLGYLLEVYGGISVDRFRGRFVVGPISNEEVMSRLMRSWLFELTTYGPQYLETLRCCPSASV
jgi:hypothetical protein